MSKVLEGMVRAVAAAWFGPNWIKHERPITDEEIAVQKAALLWLADNVSDEMVRTANPFGSARPEEFERRRRGLSAALRAFAGSAPATPEVK